MKTLPLVLALVLLLLGCDYHVALVTTPDQPLQQNLIGLWQRQDAAGHKELLQVLPWDKHQYLIVFPAGQKDSLYARACHWRNDALPMVQITWLGSTEPIAADTPPFQYARWTLVNDTLTVQSLNPEQISNATRSSTALANSITANADDPTIFREAMIFRRHKLDK
ncbi:hypothetical protein [Oligosphaera ethanolica]|uniref:Lipoprotein n=1 Tax=Oligosphaera ethanolica TaxID=760260 RepID=A0AAE3VGU8_9BACT|nr:hypothetical protein [Oligosphaera ethanolica]MDQ0290130.1 hypothetical protein [Oligosphaera ethanolica]